MEAAYGLMLREADHGRRPSTTWEKLMEAAHGSKLMEADHQGSDTELYAAAGHFGLAATARTLRSRRLTGRRISGFHAAPLTRLRSAASSIEEPRPRLRLDVSEADCDGDSGLTGF